MTAALVELLDGRRLCSGCGEETEWDTQHEPHAWRHVETDTRWCTPDPPTVAWVP